MKGKRVLSGILASILILSSFLTSYASIDSGGSSAGQGSGTGSGGTNNKGNGTWNMTSNTGFRFTIVNGSGNPVSNILGEDNIVSLDVVNDGIKDSGEFWSPCATDSNRNKDAHKMKIMSMKQFMSGISEESYGNLYWMDENKTYLGNQVREFILKGTNSSTDSNIDGSGQNNIGLKSEDYISKMEEFHQLSKTGLNSRKEAIKLRDSITALRPTFITAVKEEFAGDGYAQWAIVFRYNMLAYEIQDYIYHQFPHKADDGTLVVPERDSKKTLTEDKSFFGCRWEEFEEAWKVYQEELKKQRTFANIDFFHLFGGITAYADTNDANKPNINDSANGNIEISDDKSVLSKIINMNIDGVYVFQLEGAVKTRADYLAGKGKKPSQIFVENNYVLLVENTIQGRPQEYQGNWRNYPSLVYGTAHNWAMFLQTPGWKNIYTGDSAGNHLTYINIRLVNGLMTKSDWIGLNESIILKTPDHEDKWKNSEMISKYNYGYGCHIYTAFDLTKKIPLIDTGSPSDSENPEEIIINRFFRTKNKDGSYTYTESDTHSYKLNEDRQVNINSVANDNYALVEWGTNTDELWKAEKTDTWDIAKQKNKGDLSGTTSTVMDIKKSDTKYIKTINVLYEEAKQTKVIKVYEESGEVVKVTTPEIITDTEYNVPDEPDYEYTENKKSDDPPKTITNWEDTEGTSSTDKVIKVDEETETIYILYQKDKVKQLKLYSNELSYTYGLTDLLENRILFSIYDTVPTSPGTYPSCGGHGRRGKSCTLYSHKLTDSSWTIKVSNTYDYVGLTNYIRDYENTSGLGGSWSVGSSNVNGVDISYTSSKTAKPDGTFLLYRDKDSDLVTLYPKKNDSLSIALSTLGIEIGSASYTPHGDRMGIELANDSSFLRNFMTRFEYTEHENVLGWSWLRSKCNRNHKGNFLTHTVTSPADANAFYNKTNSIKEYYLLGQSNTGSEDVSDVRSDSFGTKYSYNKAYSSTSSDLKFYPYHLMLYRAKNSNSSPQNVYVTSENLSTMKVYNAVQLGVYKKNPINALLSSTQWSTHARSLSFSANTDKKSVLPGGAVLDLDMGSKGDTELGIRLWQSCLRDEQVETVQVDGFTTSLSKAKEIASNYQSEVKDVLEGYGLVQWGTEGVQTDLNGVLGSGVELHNNTSLNWDNRSYSTSNDSKYYLKHNGSGSDRANFDVLDNKITKQVFYEISSDVDGNVILKKDNVEIVRASLTQDKSAILSNTEAKLLDDNTKLVSNYFSSIDRGLGDSNKYDRTNSRKYNEAFDGVGVLMTELGFAVGFSDNSGHRTTVLDTLLTSTSESKSDLYNFSDEKVRSFVFATTENSTGSVEAESVGYIGTLSGDSTMQDLYTVLSDIQSFVYSKNFYTSNFNVTDLN